MGVYENQEFNYGTKKVFEAIANSKAFSLAGGGNTIAAIHEYGLTKKIGYISTAGRAEAETSREISASRIAEICSTAGILYPGATKAGIDQEKAPPLVGRIMAKLFAESDRVAIDGFSVERHSREEKDQNYVNKMVHRYVFEQAS